jgi:hypothetical protein
MPARYRMCRHALFKVGDHGEPVDPLIPISIWMKERERFFAALRILPQ